VETIQEAAEDHNLVGSYNISAAICKTINEATKIYNMYVVQRLTHV